MIVQIHYYI